jgi:hypothetical protein
MKLRIVLSLLLFFPLLGAQLGWAQSQSDKYPQTRKWLLKMDRRSPNKEIRKLFEEADARMPDLIRALDDTEKDVSINSQVIIKYLAEPEGLAALDDWYQKRKEQGKEYWIPKMNLLSEAKYLEGNDSDVARLVLKNKHLFEAFAFNASDVSARLIAYNKRAKTALVELIQGRVFTAGWHAVIKREGDKWRLMSDNNIWVH